MRSSRNRTLTTFAVLVFSIPILYGGCNDPCGNGKLEPDKGEQCDDGNKTPGDGCSATCQIETTATNCVAATLSEWTAAAADPEAVFLLGIASNLHYGTTGTDVYNTKKCSEGGPITQWFAQLKSQSGNQPDGIFLIETDAPPGQKATFIHPADKRALTTVYTEFQGLTAATDYTVNPPAVTITGRDGLTYPLPGSAAPLQDSAPAQPAEPAGNEGGGIGYPSAAFAATGPDVCTELARQQLNALAKNLLADKSDLVASGTQAINCLGSPTGCSDGNADFFRDARIPMTIYDKPPADYTGAACTDLMCNRGKCSGPAIPTVCVTNNPPVSDCNTACNEQCDTTTGICAGAKVLAVSVERLMTDDEVWRCGGAQNLAGYDCPARGDPFYDNVVTQQSTYTPNMTVSWCGRLSQTGLTRVTEECGTSPPGWTCTQGSSFFFDKTMPNPVVLPHPEWCCSLGSPLPATFGRLMSITTGSAGAGDKLTFNTTCQPQVSACKLCDCTPPDDVGDIIDNPVCGWNGFQCPAN
jgi:cysteine-rich repeat protein